MSMLTVTLVIALVFGSYAEEEDFRGGSQAPRYFGSPNEPQGDQGYAEQCRATNLWKGQLGYVNVFAFLDPSWHYSYRQTVMLELLKKRLDRSGFSNILFFVVTPSSNLPENSVENNIEIRTWKEISKNSVGQKYIWGIDETQLNNQTENKERGIIFLRDAPELGIWEHFRASRDEVVVLDRCGKLTYQVIIPWSILYFPYVKAAILSTYKEYPCGPCDEQPSPVYNTMEYEEYLFENANSNTKGAEKNPERAPDNLKSENVTASSEETQENEENTSLNANETSVVTDAPFTKIDLSIQENNNTEDNGSFTADQVEPTTEVSLEQEQTEVLSTVSDFKTTEDYKGALYSDFLKEETGTSSDNLLFTIINTRKNPEELKSEETTKSELKKDEDLPLRIVLYAPHTHQENQTSKEYTHLVLKSGSPEYHDHFHSMNGIYKQEPVEKTNPTTVGDKNVEKFAKSTNESPGVYGEIAYYWRTTEDEELNNQDDNVELLKLDDDAMEGAETKINNDSDTLVQSSDDEATDADTKMKVDEDSEELVQRRLIEHYNKLIPWIHYIL
ncbi:uncharacterized protein LOC143219945 [Lasioglossum baleicum]|uniref:uncharacterized protein LOC143219945 n=1 Tax=Lasioglossum baleicum TaxID=434251 RepID=UPI003FCD8250